MRVRRGPRVAGVIADIVIEDEASVRVRLEAQNGTLYARVTPAAASEFGLARGATAWAIVRAHAL